MKNTPDLEKEFNQTKYSPTSLLTTMTSRSVSVISIEEIKGLVSSLYRGAIGLSTEVGHSGH